MIKKHGFVLRESGKILLLAALYKEARLRSCEPQTHAHTARRSFKMRNTGLYKNPRSISVRLPGRRLHLPGSGPSQTILFPVWHLQSAGSTLTQGAVLGPQVKADQEVT